MVGIMDACEAEARTGTTIAFGDTSLWIIWRGADVADLSFHPPTGAGGTALGDEVDWLDKSDLSIGQRRLAVRLERYFRGTPDDFRDVTLDLDWCRPFQRRVIAACRDIPYGEVRTYGELAAEAGSPRASRAVGNVMRTNRFPIIVPCHRVVRAGGHLGGFSAPTGLDLKRRLLGLEGSLSTLSESAC